jgi:AcrR family transcriptional regulator
VPVGSRLLAALRGLAPGGRFAPVKVESEPRPDRRPRETAAATVPRSSRGRPRQPATEDAILRSTIELLTEVGVPGTTTNAIVARSGCSKATLYRRWPSRDILILEALRTAVSLQPRDIHEDVELEQELGSTVQAAARRGAKVFDSRIFRAVFPTIAKELLSDGTIGQHFRADVFSPIRAAARARLREAVDRGEIDGKVDADLVFDLVYGALLYRLLIGEPIDEGVADSLAAVILNGAGGSRSRKDAC